MGTQWAGMGRSLMQLQEFRESILRSDEALKDTGLCISRLLMEADENTFEDTVHAFVGLAAIQVRVFPCHVHAVTELWPSFLYLASLCLMDLALQHFVLQ